MEIYILTVMKALEVFTSSTSACVSSGFRRLVCRACTSAVTCSETSLHCLSSEDCVGSLVMLSENRHEEKGGISKNMQIIHGMSLHVRICLRICLRDSISNHYKNVQAHFIPHMYNVKMDKR